MKKVIYQAILGASFVLLAGIQSANCSELPPIELGDFNCPDIQYVFQQVGQNETPALVGYKLTFQIPEAYTITVILDPAQGASITYESLSLSFSRTVTELGSSNAAITSLTKISVNSTRGSVKESGISESVVFPDGTNSVLSYVVSLHDSDDRTNFISDIISLSLVSGANCQPPLEGTTPQFSSFFLQVANPKYDRTTIIHRGELLDVADALNRERETTANLNQAVTALSEQLALKTDEGQRAKEALARYVDKYNAALSDVDWLTQMLVDALQKTKKIINQINKGNTDKARRLAIGSLKKANSAISERSSS